MKNTFFLILLSLLFFSGIAHAASDFDVSLINFVPGKTPYVCWTHPHGSPDKVAKVWAKSEDEAVVRANEDFRLMDIKPIGVQCKVGPRVGLGILKREH